MRTIAASGLIALSAMIGVAASMTVAGPATAAQLPTTAGPAKPAGAARPIKPAKAQPPANQLYGVSCPSSKYCAAVGINENAEVSVKGGGALIQTWNGKTWTAGTPARPAGSDGGQLDNVSCRTAGSCLAVGSYYTSAGSAALAERVRLDHGQAAGAEGQRHRRAH